jgi:hypothetical protein
VLSGLSMKQIRAEEKLFGLLHKNFIEILNFCFAGKQKFARFLLCSYCSLGHRPILTARALLTAPFLRASYETFSTGSVQNVIKVAVVYSVTRTFFIISNSIAGVDFTSRHFEESVCYLSNFAVILHFTSDLKRRFSCS